MPQIQPEQAHFLLHGLYLPGLKNEQAITRRVIEAIPADKGDYRPDAVSKTAMELAWHIVAAEMRFLEAAATGTFDMGPRPKPDSIQNSADLSAWYTENFNRRLEALTKLTDEQLVKIIDFRGIMQVPAVMI